MGVFDRFRRKQNTSVLPEEVNQYYQAEKRERRGMAVLLGFITLILTLLIAVGLFYGGRAVYRNFNKDDQAKQPITTTDQQEQKQKDGSPRPDDKPAETNTNSQGQTPSTNTPVTPPAPAPSPTTTPSTGDQPSLPHTGDEGL